MNASSASNVSVAVGLADPLAHPAAVAGDRLVSLKPPDDASTDRGWGKRTRRAAALAALALAGLSPAARAAPPGDPLVQAELRFADSVAAHGIPQGFLEHLADSAVVLTPEPRPARPLYEPMADNGARLTWRPDLVSLAHDGDFGWTSGPWLHFARDATTADSGGHYFTVWRRGAAGDWQVILDGGIEHPVDAGTLGALPAVAVRTRAAAKHGPKTEPDCTQRFLDAWRDGGRERALKGYAANDVRLLQPETAPLEGRAGLAGDVFAGAKLNAAHVTRRLQSSAGDEIVAYGEYVLSPTQVALAHRYVFVAAFDAANDCRLALELVTPIAESAR